VCVNQIFYFMKKQVLLFSVILLLSFILVSFTYSPVYSTDYTSIYKSEQVKTPRFNPRSFYQKQCSFCHNANGKIGPPMEEVKKIYLKKYPKPEEFIEKMTAFVLNPAKENRLIKENEGIYGIMPSGMFKDALKIEKVVQYIYNNIKVKGKRKPVVNKKEKKENQSLKVTVVINKGENLENLLNLNKISFKRNSIKLDEKIQSEIDKVIIFLQNNKHINIEIRNYTDAIGTAENNLKISSKRAQIIKNYMVTKGIDPHRIKTKGLGETELLNHCTDNVKCSEAEHAVNRRTEFIII